MQSRTALLPCCTAGRLATDTLSCIVAIMWSGIGWLYPINSCPRMEGFTYTCTMEQCNLGTSQLLNALANMMQAGRASTQCTQPMSTPCDTSAPVHNAHSPCRYTRTPAFDAHSFCVHSPTPVHNACRSCHEEELAGEAQGCRSAL
jgi:hypothetical protein